MMALQPQRVLELAHAFVEQARRDLERAAADGSDLPPRLRTVTLRAGQASPELRTLAIPIPPGAEGASPEVLSGQIARYTADRPATCLLLVLDVLTEGEAGEARPLLIAEARARGTRMFMMQPFQVGSAGIDWEEPVGGGWQDPGAEEMILDAAFSR